MDLRESEKASRIAGLTHALQRILLVCQVKQKMGEICSRHCRYNNFI